PRPTPPHKPPLHAALPILGERLASEGGAYVDRSIIAQRDKPFEPQGGLVALFGNLAPKGAILKRSAADAKLFEHVGRAVVFSSLDRKSTRLNSSHQIISYF